LEIAGAAVAARLVRVIATGVDFRPFNVTYSGQDLK